MSGSFGQRVLGFAPNGDAGRDDLSYDDDEDKYYNSSSSLLAGGMERGEFTFNLSKLGDKRRRPFVSSGITLGVVGICLIFSALCFAYSNFVYTPAATSFIPNHVLLIGMSVGFAVAFFEVLHLYTVYKFSNDECRPSFVTMTNSFQLLSIMGIAGAAAFVVRDWKDPENTGVGILNFMRNPTQVWLLGNLGAMAMLLVFAIFVSTSIPYRKINRIYSSNIMSLSMMTTVTGLATVVLSASQLIMNSTLAQDNLAWIAGVTGMNAFLALSSLSLAATVYRANRINALWMLLNLANIGGAATLVVYGMMTYGTNNYIQFAMIATMFVSVLMMSMTFAHQLIWKYVNFYDAPNRFSTANRNAMYVDV